MRPRWVSPKASGLDGATSACATEGGGLLRKYTAGSHRLDLRPASRRDVRVGPDRVLVKVGLENLKVLAEVADLGPVTLHIQEIARKIRQRALEDLGVQGRVETRVGAAHDVPGLVRVLDRQIHRAPKSAHEALDLGDVILVVLVGGHKLDGAEAAATEAIKLVDAEHAHRFSAQLLELDPLEIGEANARVDLATHDSVSHIHADTDHGVFSVGNASL